MTVALLSVLSCCSHVQGVRVRRAGGRAATAGHTTAVSDALRHRWRPHQGHKLEGGVINRADQFPWHLIAEL